MPVISNIKRIETALLPLVIIRMHDWPGDWLTLHISRLWNSAVTSYAESFVGLSPQQVKIIEDRTTRIALEILDAINPAGLPMEVEQSLGVWSYYMGELLNSGVRFYFKPDGVYKKFVISVCAVVKSPNNSTYNHEKGEKQMASIANVCKKYKLYEPVKKTRKIRLDADKVKA